MPRFACLAALLLAAQLKCCAATEPTITTSEGSLSMNVGSGKTFSITCPSCDGNVPCIGKEVTDANGYCESRHKTACIGDAVVDDNGVCGCKAPSCEGPQVTTDSKGNCIPKVDVFVQAYLDKVGGSLKTTVGNFVTEQGKVLEADKVAQKAALDKKSQEIDATVGALAKKLLSKPKIYAVHKTMPAVYIRAEGDSVVLAGEGFPAKAKVTLDVGKKVVTPTKIEVSDDKDFITVTIPKLDIGDVCGGGSGGDAATTVLKVYGEDGKAFTSRTLYVDQKASEFGDGSDGDYDVKGKTYIHTQNLPNKKTPFGVQFQVDAASIKGATNIKTIKTVNAVSGLKCGDVIVVANMQSENGERAIGRPAFVRVKTLSKDSKTIELMDAIPALTETPKATVVLQRVPQFKTLTFHKDGFFQAAEFGVTNLALGQFGTGIIAVMAKKIIFDNADWALRAAAKGFPGGIPGKTNGPMDVYKLTIGGGFAGQRVNGGGHNRPASYGGAGCGVGFGGRGGQSGGGQGYGGFNGRKNLNDRRGGGGGGGGDYSETGSGGAGAHCSGKAYMEIESAKEWRSQGVIATLGGGAAAGGGGGSQPKAGLPNGIGGANGARAGGKGGIGGRGGGLVIVAAEVIDQKGATRKIADVRGGAGGSGGGGGAGGHKVGGGGGGQGANGASGGVVFIRYAKGDAPKTNQMFIAGGGGGGGGGGAGVPNQHNPSASGGGGAGAGTGGGGGGGTCGHSNGGGGGNGAGVGAGATKGKGCGSSPGAANGGGGGCQGSCAGSGGGRNQGGKSSGTNCNRGQNANGNNGGYGGAATTSCGGDSNQGAGGAGGGAGGPGATGHVVISQANA